MKILLLNNYHYPRDGASRSYFDLAEILTKEGNEVAFFSTVSEKNLPTPWSRFFVNSVDFEAKKINFWSRIKALANGFYNFQAKRNLEALLKEFKPDVAHLHNIYHHLSPSVIDVLKKHKIPMVMTLHDYKLISPNYNLFANGKIWENCRNGKYWHCFIDRCIKNSYFKSFLAMLESYFASWTKIYEKIDLFISPSHFLLNKFKEFDFKPEIFYLTYPILSEALNKNIFPSPEKYILYAGRLSPEKGVGDLLRAYATLAEKPILKIAGTGAEEENLKKLVVDNKILGVEFLGYQAKEALMNLIDGAEFIVVPSVWYENAPYAVLEVMAVKKVVLASDLGGLPELIRDNETGFIFQAGSKEELAEKIKYLLVHRELREKIGEAGADFVKENNNPEKYYQILLGIYKRVIEK